MVIGSRLDLRQVGTKANDFAKKSKIIRIDIDKNEIINSRVKCDINVNFDLNTVIKEILRKLPKKYSSSTEWINQTEYLKKKYKLNYKKIKSLKPQEIIETINIYKKKIQSVFQESGSINNGQLDILISIIQKTLVHFWGHGAIEVIYLSPSSQFVLPKN